MLVLAQEVKQGKSGSFVNMQQHDPSASWALQQFWQRSAASQAPRPSPALHPASQSPCPSPPPHPTPAPQRPCMQAA